MSITDIAMSLANRTATQYDRLSQQQLSCLLFLKKKR